MLSSEARTHLASPRRFNCFRLSVSKANSSCHKCCLMRSLALITFGLTLLLPIRPASAIINAALQMQLGNPSNATADPSNTNHYLIHRTVEAIDYNATFAQPTW